MDIKKLCGGLLTAAVVGSMITMTAAARSEIPEEEVPEYLSSGNHTFGLCGDFTGWEEFGDLMLADPDGDGLYVGYIKDPGEGEHQFKVRADGDWEDNWGAYNEEMEVTFNSRDNYKFELESGCGVFVTFDARGRDPMLWNIEIYPVSKLTPSKYGITGTMTQWGLSDPDYHMYELAENWFVGVVEDCPFGEQQFKVRADNEWVESYGVYEEEYDRTNNSQTNCKTDIPGSGNIIVELNTSGKDEMLWPVSFSVIDSENNICDEQFTGKEKPSLPSHNYSSEPESSVESSKTEESSKKTESSEDSVITSHASVTASETTSQASKNTAAANTVNTTPTPVTSTSAVADVPKTGDETAVIAFIVVSVSALGVLTLASGKKKAKETE